MIAMLIETSVQPPADGPPRNLDWISLVGGFDERDDPAQIEWRALLTCLSFSFSSL
jgi:hypothetical protein